jgi:hypothetical protein
MRAKPKTAIDLIREIECRPKKTITISGRAAAKRGGAIMIKDRKMEGKSVVKETLISKKVKEG